MSLNAFTYYGPDAIRSAIGFEALIDPVAHALADFSRGLGESPVAVFAPAGPDGDVHVKSAWLPGRAIFTVKVATWFAARAVNGQVPGSGVVAAFDAATGDLLALLEDEHHLSDVRTAAAGALAARVLARPDSRILGVLGTGVQAYLQVLAAKHELPLREVRVWGRDATKAATLATALRARCPDLRVRVVLTAREACEGVDVLVTATASTVPMVQADWLMPGVHVTAVGADDSAKVELAPECFTRADRVIVDSRDLAARYGDLAAAGFAPGAELGEILADSAAGRESREEITIAKLIGLGVQDLAAAEVALAALGPGANRSPAPASAQDLRRAAAG